MVELDERTLRIEEVVKKDHITNDVKYNKGLKLIKKFGYSLVWFYPEVEYWCLCNNL